MASRNVIKSTANAVARCNAPVYRRNEILRKWQNPIIRSYPVVAAVWGNNNTIGRVQQRQQQVAWFSDKTETKDPTDAESAEQSGEQAAPAEEDLTKRIADLEAEVKDLNDKLLRSLAEQDNTRRIAKVDVDNARQFAIKSFAKSMLDVADNLERALKAVPEAMQNDKEAHPVLATLYEGIEMTQRGLNKTFESNGLVKYGKDGEVFDPNLHDALFEYPDPEKTPGTIGQVIKSGFLLNKRVLRPAEVGVIKKA